MEKRLLILLVVIGVWVLLSLNLLTNIERNTLEGSVVQLIDNVGQEKWTLSKPIGRFFPPENEIAGGGTIPKYKGIQYFAVFWDEPVKFRFSLDFILEGEASLPEVFIFLVEVDTGKILEQKTLTASSEEYQYISGEVGSGFYDIWIGAEGMYLFRIRIEEEGGNK